MVLCVLIAQLPRKIPFIYYWPKLVTCPLLAAMGTITEYLVFLTSVMEMDGISNWVSLSIRSTLIPFPLEK